MPPSSRRGVVLPTRGGMSADAAHSVPKGPRQGFGRGAADAPATATATSNAAAAATAAADDVAAQGAKHRLERAK